MGETLEVGKSFRSLPIYMMIHVVVASPIIVRPLSTPQKYITAGTAGKSSRGFAGFCQGGSAPCDTALTRTHLLAPGRFAITGFN